VLSRLILVSFVALSIASAASSPEAWVPLRWDGGPLELARRLGTENPIETESQRRVIENWYAPETLGLLKDGPYNCVVLTWSLGRATDADAAQRELVTKYVGLVRERDLTVLGSVEFGPDWEEAVRAAAAQALATLRAVNDEAVVIPMGNWQHVHREAEFPILANLSGLWPGMLSVSEAEEWGAGPTSNPWVLSNAWQVGVLLADGSNRPAWMGHRPTKHRPQPLEFADHARAVADVGMAGGTWVVALGDDLRERIHKGDSDALQDWRRLGEYVKFFRDREEWRAFESWPSVVVVHDPAAGGEFDSFDVLNMLSVYHVPHRVVLRKDFPDKRVEDGSAVLVYDFEPGPEPEVDKLREFTGKGGTLLLGPRWREAGDSAPELIAGAGSIRRYPAEEIDSDRFSRNVRDLVEDKHAAPRPYNVGSIISLYRYDPSSDRALLQMTEYGHYPTENITVRFPREIKSARVHSIEGEPVELKVYEGDKGGSEIDIPEVPGYCGVIIEFQQGDGHAGK